MDNVAEVRIVTHLDDNLDIFSFRLGDIKIGKRTIVQYMLSRVIPVATESMREP